MDRMNRSFGRLMGKGPGNNARVSTILKEFDDAEGILVKIVDDSKLLRDSWVTLGNSQLGMAKEYQELYDPIVGASDGPRRPSETTPDQQLSRTYALREVYATLKDELLQEVVALDTSVIQPATDARKCIAPLRKTIKKREEKMYSYEKAQEKVKKLQKRGASTPKEESALAKAETEMTLAGEEFQIADDHLSGTLPPLVQATFNLVPCLLAGIINTENRLLGVYYTVLHNYCQENGFPSPPPPMSNVVADWSAAYDPLKSEVEAFHILANGKAIRQPMDGSTGPSAQAPRPSGIRRITTGFGGKDKSNNGASPPEPVPARPARIASNPAPSMDRSSPELSRQSSSNTLGRSGLGMPTDFTTASGHHNGAHVASSPGYTHSREKADYFGHQSSQLAYNGNSNNAYTPPAASPATTPGAAAAAIAAKKKKPPPPPPKPRAAPTPPAAEYVVAEHTFAGTQDGDLAFSEGDRIKIVKKTGTTDDWWEGELNGVRGHFPANFCRAA